MHIFKTNGDDGGGGDNGDGKVEEVDEGIPGHLGVHVCPLLVLLLVSSQLLQGLLQLGVLSLQTLLQLLVALQEEEHVE